MKTSPAKPETAPKTMRPPLTEEKQNELKERYSDAANTGHFNVYFGKYKNMTFENLYKQDSKYVDFVISKPPITNNMYLFKRYCEAIREEALAKQEAEIAKSKPKSKTRSKSAKVAPLVLEQDSKDNL